jgi:5-methylcytosine-specific restriction endonuclease McrA
LKAAIEAGHPAADDRDVDFGGRRAGFMLSCSRFSGGRHRRWGGAHSSSKPRRICGDRRVPSVIRLLEYRRIPMQARSLSRKNILMRDRYTCQYCHRTLPSGELTLDHVVPRSRAGESAWENLVACCNPCNNRKGSRTPEEAGMKLARLPRPFSLHTSRHLMRLLGKSDDQWRKYLFF